MARSTIPSRSPPNRTPAGREPAATSSRPTAATTARTLDAEARAGRGGAAEPSNTLRAEARARRGSAAERAVAAWLEERGFQIVATNLRLGRLELDIVARRERLIVVVEVRTRGPTAWQSGFGSIGIEKRERIRRAAERLWRDRYARDSSVDRMRFDAASVRFENERPVVEYVAAAF